MWKGWLGADQRRGSTVLEISGRVGISMRGLRNFELVGVEEELSWLDNGADLCRNLLSIDSPLNRINPSTNIPSPNPEQGYRTKFETLLE